MRRLSSLIFVLVAVMACGGGTVTMDGGTGGGSAATGGGDAATGGGSASTGGGSATTGGGSAVTGGGTATTGGGSAVTGGGTATTGGGDGSTGGGTATTGGGDGSTGGGAATGGGTGTGGGFQGTNGGDTCAVALDVTAGGRFDGTTDDSSVNDDYGNGLTTGCPSGGSGSGKDVAYVVSPTVTTRYTVTVTPQNSSYDPMLYVQSTCGPGACLEGTVFNGPGQAETVSFTVMGGNAAFIIVDGEANSRGPFELTISTEIVVVDAGMPMDAGTSTDGGVYGDGGVPYLNGGNTCAMAPDVTAGGTFLGTTDDSAISDDYGLSLNPNQGCPSGGAASGRDVAYLLSPFNTTTYTARITSLRTSFSPMLYAQTTCGAASCLGGTRLTSFTFTVNGGTSAYLIVDGANGSRGPFEISITH